MEYAVLDLPQVDYNFFFKELPQHYKAAQKTAKQKKFSGNEYASAAFEGLEDSIVAIHSTLECVDFNSGDFGIPYDRYSAVNLAMLMRSQQHLLYHKSRNGEYDIHYLDFGGRVLEISNHHLQWRVNWQSELIPAWLRIAYKELGTREQTGKKHNQRILEYSDDITEEYDKLVSEKVLDPITKKFKTEKHQITTTRKINIETDETAWCSYFIHWIMNQCGIQGPLRTPGLALSWRDWGNKLEKPSFGCLAVLKHADGTGHVGFVVGEEDGKVVLLGGNQSNQVNFWQLNSTFQKEIVAYVYPSSEIVNSNQNYLHAINDKVKSSGNNTR